MMFFCSVCGRRRFVHQPQFWPYRFDGDMFCSENCWICDSTKRIMERKGFKMARIKKDGTPAKKPGTKPNYKKVEKKEPEQLPTVKIDGPIVIKTPDGKETKVGTVGDALNNMADAAADFFGKCEEMGLMKEETKITQPVNYDGFNVRAVEGDYGSYHFQEINGKQWLDYDDKECANEMSMTVEQWRGFLAEIRKAAKILGVEL